MKRAILLGLALLAGCRGASPGPTQLQLDLPARGQAGQVLSLTLTALDPAGHPVRSLSAQVTIVSDDPKLRAGPPKTVAFVAGRAVEPIELVTAGPRRITVTLGALPPQTRTVEIEPGPAAKLEVVSGDDQAAPALTALPQPLVVGARDAFGNAVSARTRVTFSPPSGGSCEPAQTVTDAQGRASTHAVLGPLGGTQSFTARLETGASVELRATATAGQAAALVAVSGDGQVGTAGQPLVQPFVVRAIDASGNGVPHVTVGWSASAGATITPATTTTDDSGLARATGTLPQGPSNAAFTATLGASSVTLHAAPAGLSYGDPAPGLGSIRLELVGPGAQPGSLVLALKSAQPLSGYTVGFDLPLQGGRVALGDFRPGTALPAGANPAAAQATIAQQGPLAGQLVVAQSQKRSGQGAVAGDTVVPAGSTFLTVTLQAAPGAQAGVVFDGTLPGDSIQAGLLNLAGTEVVGRGGFAFGRLELH